VVSRMETTHYHRTLKVSDPLRHLAFNPSGDHPELSGHHFGNRALVAVTSPLG
jgi:hypothetical protein